MKILNLRILLAFLSAGYAVAGLGVFLTSLIYMDFKISIATLAALLIYAFFVNDTIRLYKESQKQ
jgi:hypothetical protein